MKKGTRIKYLSRLGALSDPNDTHFSGTVEFGDEGIYIGKHPIRQLAAKDWHITKTLTDPPLYVPVTLYQCEEVKP